MTLRYEPLIVAADALREASRTGKVASTIYNRDLDAYAKQPNTAATPPPPPPPTEYEEDEEDDEEEEYPEEEEVVEEEEAVEMVDIGSEDAIARCVELLRQAAAVGSCQAMHRLGSMVLSGEWAEMRGQGRAALHLLEFAGRGGCADALALAGHAIAAAAAGGRIAGIETPVYLEKVRKGFFLRHLYT